MVLSWASALITREPKQDLNITKSWLLRLKVGFGHLSVTLSNAGHSRKCAGDYCTFSILMTIDYGLRGCFRPWIQPVNATDWAKRSAGG